MAYEEKLDKKIGEWRYEPTGLCVSLRQYNGGEPKVQIGPRVFKTKDGEEKTRKAGRLTIKEYEFLCTIVGHVVAEAKKIKVK